MAHSHPTVNLAINGSGSEGDGISGSEGDGNSGSEADGDLYVDQTVALHGME